MYIVLVCMLVMEEHTSLVSPEAISTYLIPSLVPASYPPKISLGAQYQPNTQVCTSHTSKKSALGPISVQYYDQANMNQ
jgi:hypothetical protein